MNGWPLIFSTGTKTPGRTCSPRSFRTGTTRRAAGKRGGIVTDSTPELFGKHLREAVEMVRGKVPEHRIILLKSWNEWAEGNYVEPDLKWGRGYLEAIRREVMDE